jgi:hypothetical protein
MQKPVITMLAFAVLTCAPAMAARAQTQTSPAQSTRDAPVGHRQPTPQSVGSAEATKETKPGSRPQAGRDLGRDLGSELSICRGC